MSSRTVPLASARIWRNLRVWACGTRARAREPLKHKSARGGQAKRLSPTPVSRIRSVLLSLAFLLLPSRVLPALDTTRRERVEEREGAREMHTRRGPVLYGFGVRVNSSFSLLPPSPHPSARPSSANLFDSSLYLSSSLASLSIPPRLAFSFFFSGLQLVHVFHDPFGSFAFVKRLVLVI